MKYKRNQYSEGVSVCTLIIAGVFLWWGISTLINGNYFHPLWWASGWWGLLWLGIGLAIGIGQFSALTNKSKLRNIVKNEIMVNPNITVEQIGKNTGISLRDVRAIILDLKANGELMGKFSQETGQMQNVQIHEPKKIQSTAHIPKPIDSEEELKPKYCFFLFSLCN
ncbi:MAG: hypothetical protein P8Y70_08015 [Candidatus Lokiarchaeota archaeon]